MRQVLPQRRANTTVAFEHEGLRYIGAVGYFANGQPAEIFLNSTKANTSTDTNARDAAIAASLALQFGCSIDTLQHALTRNTDGSAAGPLGCFLDLINQRGTEK